MKLFHVVVSSLLLTSAVFGLAHPARGAVLITENRLVGAGDASLDGQAVVVRGATLTLGGTHTLASLQLEEGAVVTHELADGGQTDRAIRLTVTGDLTILPGTRLDVTGRGYGLATSPGAGGRGDYAGGGGGHAGRGSASAGGSPGRGGLPFGSIVNPDSWGGPGGNGSEPTLAPGGGLMRIQVGGALVVQGAVRADGASAWINNQGGGAGGSIYLQAEVLRGTGTITANGGAGEWVDGGGGSGGRIALILGANEFTGPLAAVGGGGAGRGAAGTVYLKIGSQPGELRLENDAPGEWTPVTSPVAFDLVVGQHAVVYPTEPLIVGNVRVNELGVLTHATGSTGLVVRASGHVSIAANGAITASGRGYPFEGQRGPGTGGRGDWAGSGGGHGGLGGNSVTGFAGGANYGSMLEPTALGSQGGDSNSGAGSAGGGAIRLVVGGLLTVDGSLTANGLANPVNNAGGGSGGSLWVTTGSLSGTGLISANGGAGEWVDGGGGGGGRVALYYGSSDFKGAIQAFGGGGSQRGGAGTIYQKATGEPVGVLLVHNGGQWGNLTPVTSPVAFRLVITGQTTVYPESALELARLEVLSEGVLTHLTGQTNLNLRIQGDALIAAGGYVSLDGKGYPISTNRGPGAGERLDWSGSGGGHGAWGGNGVTGAKGGSNYGSVLEPVDLGSGGGDSNGGPGMPGGGAVRMIVGGRLTVDGQLSANGASSAVNNSGGGAGGSIWLTVGSLTGTGVISANGGAGEWVDGGGGAGGRIAVYHGGNTFSGTLTTYGGGGSQRGGAGTIYQRQNGSAYGQLLIHNGGAWGNYTPLTSPEPFQVTLAEMATVFPQEPLTVRDLEVQTNSVITHLIGQPRCEIHVLNNLLVTAHGWIHADGRGYPVGADRGPGSGTRRDWGGSGGSHGGRGGRSGSGAEAGGVYGSPVEPLTAGSQGGDADGGAGLPGGGVIRLIVDNQLTIDGRVTAVGLDAVANNAGGGAGGSIYITAKQLSGTGVISTDGGAGEWVDGGGGGGGRIALHLGSRSFAGTIVARGGGGSVRGGAGTIYWRIANETGGELVFDNGGNPGTLSPLDVPDGTRLVLAQGTTVYPVKPLKLVSLQLKPGATVTHTNGQSSLQLEVAGDLVIEPGATLTASGRGYPLGGDPGPGAGQATEIAGAGGAHGGNGGLAWPGDVEGGLAYGSVVEPTDWGSSGGPGSGSGNPRSPGGGAIRVIVGGTLTVDGTIVSDGTTAWINNQGGGAGGSIWITAGRLTGAGAITANGGAGEWVDGGGGSGGRVALHLGASEFTGNVSARGGGGHQTGGAGTIYQRLAPATVGRVVLDNGGVWGAYTPLVSPEPFDLVLTNQAQGYTEVPIVVGSLTTAPNTALSHLKGQDAFSAVVIGDARIQGVIQVDGRGYPVGGEAGPGAGVQVDWSGGGAGHGGAGGNGATGSPGGSAYGSAIQPAAWGSQGGSGNGGPGGHGGGAVRLLVGGTLTVDGAISANGLNGTANNSGGGSGGSIFLGARVLAGGGSITANGGAGEWVDGGGGSGGRIALYHSVNSFTGTVSVAGSASGAKPGADGTIHQDSAPMVIWLSPTTEWIYGTTRIQAALFTGTTGPLNVEFSVARDGVVTRLAAFPAELSAGVDWDTRSVPDGSVELRLTARNAGGALVAEARRVVTVNNSVIWHGGSLASSETWAPGRVHVVTRDLVIPANLSLTLEPGTIVKFLPGTRFVVRGAAGLSASGTSTLPVVMTSFLDDTAGGDTNLDGDQSRPSPGAWRLALSASGRIEANDHTRFRYHSQSYGGTLAGSETWTGDSLREVTDTVVVPAGATLRIEAGAIVKFASGRGLDVRGGARLEVAGTIAQPVVFTSMLDDAFGGDSNEDGTRSAAGAGDWRSLRLEDGATGIFEHAIVRFGGNSIGNPWGAGGAIEALGGPLTFRNGIIADALKDGAFCYGTTRFENSLVLRCDRGLTAVGEMQVIHCTIDACRIGLLEHVGQLIVRNSIVSRSLDVGISHDLGGGVPVVTRCNVWNPEARQGNYAGTDDRTGRDGNISAEPRFRDADADNFRLNYASPGIDAADGAVAPATDLAGAPRYDDPRTGNTGTPSANGAVPDMGAYEFVETAPSNLDLVVTEVTGPARLLAGEVVHLEWTIANRGSEPFSGPWHDGIYLLHAVNGTRLLVAEPLVGAKVTLGPGQTHRVGADVRIPGGVMDTYQWLVAANSRGDIFEGANAANNDSWGGTTTELSVPGVTLDGPAQEGSFAVQEEQQWFQCVAPIGRDVRFTLELSSGQGVSELYVGRGFVPTPEVYTARQREFSSATTTAVASGTAGASEAKSANVFYVLVVGRVLEGVPASFRLRAESAPFSIEAVATGPVGNAGLATLDLRGSGFTPDTEFAVRLGVVERGAVRTRVRESGRAFVTFDLAGFPTGPAEVIARQGGLSVSRPSAVTVEAGGTGDFYVSVNGPGTSRAGRQTTWFVTYGNRGRADVPLPLLRVRAPGAEEIRLYDSTLNWADSFTYLALNPEVLLPTLGPGQEVTFEVRIKTFNRLEVSVEVLPGEALAASETVFPWTTLPAPAGANPAAWSALVGSLAGRLGATVADYAALLQQDLDDIASTDLRYSYLANVNGRWLFGDEPYADAVPYPIIEVPAEAEDAPATPGLHTKPAKVPGDGIRKTWFVVITDEDYTGIGASNVPDVRADWNDLQTFMKQDLRVPTNQMAGGHDYAGDASAWTHDHVANALRQFKGQVDADDNLVVVFSGHGGRTASGAGYLCFNQGYMSPAAFTRAIDDVGAGTTYFINNSCHSEAFNELVTPANTTFVGFAATKKDRVAWAGASGSPMIANLKGQLRKCRGLGTAFELTEALVAHQHETKALEKHRQHPVLHNTSGASLEGKPWNDPSGHEQMLKKILDSLPYHPWAKQGLDLVGSVDPNDKYALAGTGPERWVQPGQVLPFEVLFENKTNAAAAAQEVLVIDDLDPQLDWSTFELKTIAFNDARLTVPPGLQRYTTTAHVGSDPHEVVVDVSFNPATGRIRWFMWSRDAATGELPEDPYAGFLPPNDASHRGEGLLSYTVRARSDLADGARIVNQATIIFDPTYGANPPILTPWVTNTIDGLAPSSSVAALASQSTGEVPVQWSGTDAPGGSGIASFDIYVSRDDGSYTPWLLATTNTTSVFTGQPGSTYRFYSVARDGAGTTEPAPATPDAVTTLAGGGNFATWANTQGLPVGAAGPNDDPDLDGLGNFAEYAFGLNPMRSDSHLARPVPGLVETGGQRYLTLTYRRPKTEPGDVRYRVTTSPTLVPWAGISTVMNVGTPVDRGDHVEVSVRTVEPIGGRTQGFLRLEVSR